MSNVLEEMKTRRSIRKFKPDAIPQEILDKIIEAGTYAANGRGAQNVIIIQVTNTARKRNLKAAGAGNCLHPLGLRMNMRESDTVRSAMWTGIIRMLFLEKKTASSI